jgi:cytochrome P450
MLANPHALRAAHAEIDAVVKPGFLPSFDDQESLPYVTAIVLETLRWNPVNPLGWLQKSSTRSHLFNWNA